MAPTQHPAFTQFKFTNMVILDADADPLEMNSPPPDLQDKQYEQAAEEAQTTTTGATPSHSMDQTPF